jgi:hypothetical protein
MTNDRALPAARRCSMLLAVFALGFASAAAAQVQSGPAKPAPLSDPSVKPAQAGPTASQANSVEGVDVTAPRGPSPLADIPPEKRAAYDAEVAKQKAWQDYRRSMPRLTDNPNDDGKDYPGVQALLPGQ